MDKEFEVSGRDERRRLPGALKVAWVLKFFVIVREPVRYSCRIIQCWRPLMIMLARIGLASACHVGLLHSLTHPPTHKMVLVFYTDIN